MSSSRLRPAKQRRTASWESRAALDVQLAHKYNLLTVEDLK
jgi:hypothetical protein